MISEIDSAAPQAALSVRSIGKHFQWLKFSGVNEARAYASMNMARGTVVMSNIFLSTALITLAREAAGCESTDDVLVECSQKVYGFKPGSLITNIATIGGFLSALLMPVIGAIMDNTPYRKSVGILSSVLLALIQIVQIGTVKKTWFIMAILQAVSLLLYSSQMLAQYAYLPDIGRRIGEEKMNDFNAKFNGLQFGSSLCYLLAVNAIALVFNLNSVQTGHLGQTSVSFVMVLCYAYGWYVMPGVPAFHEPKPNSNILTEGFLQMWITAKHINKEYSGGLRWFFLATLFGEAGMNAFLSTSISFMSEALNANSSEIGIVFLIVFISIIPGVVIGALVSKKINPKHSWELSIFLFCLVNVAAGFVITGPDKKHLLYVWAVMWGLLMGWFYGMESLIYTLSVPKESEDAGLAGFFIYCRIFLIWLPPSVYTLFNELEIDMKWGILSVTMYYVISLLCLFRMDSWTMVLEVAKGNAYIESTKPKNIAVDSVIDP